MHLHRLTLQAIGPFPGRHTIDFAALSASGLFLLEGPTGSGKSTIIDAIVFALYGKVASREASEERLRSGHAAPDDDSFVDLVFEAGSGIYRVRRSPAYLRPKRNRAGTTQQPASAKLWRLTSPDAPEDGDVVATRPDEVGSELQRVIGLDREQFVQTVVLPQGEFASFLRAKPEERRGLLQRVFGTEVYDQVEQRLVAMRQESTRALQAAREGVGLATEHFLGAGGLSDDDAASVRASLTAGETEGPAVLLEVVERAVAAVRAAADEARAAADRARETRNADRRVRDEAERVLATVRRRTGLLVERAALATVAAEHGEDVRRLAIGRRAQRVWPALVGAEQSAVAVAEAEVAVGAARTAAGLADVTLLGLVDEATTPEVRLKSLATDREVCATRRTRLDRPLELELGLASRRERFEAATGSLGRLRAQREATGAELAGRAEQRVEVVSRRAVAAEVADGLITAEAEVQTARRRGAAAEQAVRLAGEVEVASSEGAGTKRAARAAADAVAGLHRARIAGIAAELAVGLEPGSPCPVCGGREHPHRAEPGPEPVTPEIVQAAEAVRVAAEKRLTEVAGVLGDLAARLDEARAASGGLDLPAAREALDVAEGLAGRARAGVGERDRLDAELTTFDAATERLKVAAAELEIQIAGSAGELGGMADRLALDEAEVTAAREDASSVTDAAGALDRRIAAAVAWIAALDNHLRAKGRRVERADDLAAAMAEHAFDDVAAVRSGIVDDAGLAALDAAVRKHEASVARVEAALAEPELVGLADLTVELAAEGFSGAEARHAAADAEATRTEGEAGRRADRATSSATAADHVRRAVGELDRVRREAGPVIRMANVVAAAGGDNAKQLSLGTYVLVRRFEDVVAAANVRLQTMLGGRFELASSEERERGGARKLGLAMKVLDHTTGEVGDVRRLSGGETFCVALSMALGLTDVVTAEAGGIDLGTLFIDEGFGTLDGETLDTVLATLSRLREGGRVVGVVSHVDAMKQSIAERVEVRRTQDGTSTLTVRA